MLKIASLASVLGVTSANPYYQDEKYKAPKGPQKLRRDDPSEPLYVHFLAHSHDDVGWIKTVDEYYVGADQTRTPAEVNLIISTVIEELEKNEDRKFTYVEMKFFHMWYTRQDQETKDKVKKFISDGRFEIVNGGWSMHDEAAPHYEDMINNMYFGHQFLKDEFGVTPRIGWHIDPFGHSNANPRLFHDLGFDAWIFARLDYEDKNEREANKAMNFLWRPFSKHFGDQKEIFTAVMRDHYCWAPGFTYDERWLNDDPFVTDPTL